MLQAMSELSVTVPGKGSTLQQSQHLLFIFLFIYEDFMKKPSDSKSIILFFILTLFTPLFRYYPPVPTLIYVIIKKKAQYK